MPLPEVKDGGVQFTARYVAVDAQPNSLCVGVQTPQGVQILLNASSLYGRIQPHETVWSEPTLFYLKLVSEHVQYAFQFQTWTRLKTSTSIVSLICCREKMPTSMEAPSFVLTVMRISCDQVCG